jgi:hypothetical protein
MTLAQEPKATTVYDLYSVAKQSLKNKRVWRKQDESDSFKKLICHDFLTDILIMQTNFARSLWAPACFFFLLKFWPFTVQKFAKSSKLPFQERDSAKNYQTMII